MKYGSIVMAILLFIGLGPTARGQSVQTNGLRDRQIAHLPIMGTNVPYGLSREFLGAPSNHRLHTGFMTRIDSLRMKGLSYLLSNDKFIPDGRRKASDPALAKLSPQSLISVIDTAIVRGTTDTTRHVYTFNAGAKMTSDLWEKLTGDQWVGFNRETYTFDASNNMLSDLTEYISSGQWVNSRRHTYTYDANGHMLSESFELWEEAHSLTRLTYTYDTDGDVLTELFEDWLNGQWVNDFRTTSTYDASKNLLSQLGELWSNGEWTNSSRYTYAYDASNNMLSELYDTWSSGQWVNIYLYTFTYDAIKNMLSQLHETWSGSQWMNIDRTARTYDASNNMLSELYDTWSNGQWETDVRYSYTYDANGHLLSLLDEGFAGRTSNRFTYTYDAHGNMLSWLAEYSSNGQWVNGILNTYAYDGQENVMSVWYYAWVNSSWTPIVFPFPDHIFGVTDSAGNSYSLGWGYHYSLIRRLTVTGVASQSVSVPPTYSLSQNFPNPFNPSTTIRYGLPQRGDVSLVVFNTLGQQVAMLVNGEQGAGNHEVRFDASNLSSGVYFYRVIAGDFVQTRKLLLIR